jgi:hypothetical protein
MSGRVNVVFTDKIFELIKEIAEEDERSLSQTVSILVRESLIERGLLSEVRKTKGETPTPRRSKLK